MRRYFQNVCAALAILSAPLGAWGEAETKTKLTAEVIAALEAGDVHAEVWRDSSRVDDAMDVFSAVDIAATPEVIWAVMTDCERSQEIVKKMVSCKVTETGEGWDIRAQKVRSGMFTTKSVFRSDYEFPSAIRISKAGGDMEVQEGVWRLEPLSSGKTRVSYRAASCPKFPVPAGMLKRAMAKDVPEILRRLRAEAEADVAN